MRSVLALAGTSGANARHTSPGRKTMPLVAPRSMKPATVSTPPASRSHQRARPLRASGIRPTTASSAPVRMHLRIRLVRVNRRAPNLSAEPADCLHTTRFRRCDRSIIAASCNPGYALRGCSRGRMPGQAVGAVGRVNAWELGVEQQLPGRAELGDEGHGAPADEHVTVTGGL